MKSYKYILLDWDGNLAKTLDVWLEAARTGLESRGLHLSDEEIAWSFGNFTKYWQEWGITDVDAAFSEVDALAKQKLPDVELYPDTLEVLAGLHAAGKHLALITSSLRNNVDHLLEKYDLAKFFEVIIAGEDITHHKPHPEALEKGLKGLGGNKQEAIMIGDSDKDVLAAKNMGIDSILFYPDEHSKFYNFDRLRELGPTHIVKDMRRVLEIV